MTTHDKLSRFVNYIKTFLIGKELNNSQQTFQVLQQCYIIFKSNKPLPFSYLLFKTKFLYSFYNQGTFHS